MENIYGVEDGFSEFDYLNIGGRGRYYRELIRFMYFELQKKEYLFSHEILNELRKKDFFKEYTEEDCNKDLEFLFKKGNVIKYKNDYGQIKSLDELKKKRYRYQLSERARLIENLIVNNFNKINTLNSNLDPNLLIRLREELDRINKEYRNLEDKIIYSRWISIMNAFKILRENYQGYIMELNNFEYEKLIESEDFLRKKGRLKEYLEDFINTLINESSHVGKVLLELEKNEKIDSILLKVAREEYEKSQLVGESDYNVEKNKVKNLYEAMRRWFLTDNINESEAENLRKSTLNIINKITRLAKIFIDREKISYSRKESYKHIAKLILEKKDREESNIISSVVFGDFKWNHIKGNYINEAEELISVEEAYKIRFEILNKKIKRREAGTYRIKNKTSIKESTLYELERERKDEREMLKKYIVENEGIKYIFVEKLPVINIKTKDLVINLIRRGLAKVRNDEKISVLNDKLYYEYGEAKYNSFRYKIFRPDNGEDRCILESYDGKLNLPAFIIEILGEENI